MHTVLNVDVLNYFIVPLNNTRGFNSAITVKYRMLNFLFSFPSRGTSFARLVVRERLGERRAEKSNKRCNTP